MQSVSAAFIAEARDRGGTEVLKVEWLDATSLETKQDLSLELVAGQVTVERAAEGRRGFSMTLKNDHGLWTPTGLPTDPLFMNNVIRISLGLALSGSVEYCPLGTFRINKPHADTQQRTVDVDGQDFWKDFSWGLRYTVRFAPATTINSMILALAAAAGVTRVSLDPLGDAVALQAAPGPSLKFRRGTRVADCFAVLTNDYGWDFFFDVLGTLVTRPSLAIDQQAAVFTLVDTQNCFKRSRGGFEDSPDIFNHVGVSSTDPAFVSAFGEAMDDNALSPTYVGGTFGNRYHEEELDGIQTDGQATLSAQRILRESLYLTRPAEVDTNPLPFLDVEDVLTYTDADLKISAGKYFVQSMRIPLDRGEQTMTLLEARSIGL